jgi:hypothetical protein
VKPTGRRIPTSLFTGEAYAEDHRAKAKRASDAMMKMVKIDIAALQACICGNDGGARAGSLMPETSPLESVETR